MSNYDAAKDGRDSYYAAIEAKRARGDIRTFLDGKVTLYAGDCIRVLADLAPNSVDSVVTDPPYHLTSIVKRFGGTSVSDDTKTSERSRNRSDGYARAAAGFMGKVWDGGDIAFRPETWAAVLRVLKPGGHMLAFSGTRTYHRMVCAIEDAGFEIRDSVMWHYGSGFPKSHDVSKAIDRAAGAERKVVGVGFKPKPTFHTAGIGGDAAVNEYDITAPATDAARQWQGWGTALKPATELIALCRKPLSESSIAANVLKWGTGAINVDGCRVETDEVLQLGKTGLASDKFFTKGKVPIIQKHQHSLGRWPANLIHDGSEADDGGSAARFFYTAKADAEDRIGSKHPTVKPLDLMQYLCRLITPPRGTVLDCFAGTGTTGEAAWREGFRAVLIEREAEYLADIARRMELAVQPTKRAAVAKTKNKLRGAEGTPLFG